MTQPPKKPSQTPQTPTPDRARQSHAARSAGHRTDPDRGVRSALDVAGVDLNLTDDEIVGLVREGRERR